ncbi:biliverdin-producing heme oxygenase [uncultured Roseobacter sp.]|uniref:biliverdin-producing heme oxygenase n=1 Tax=uncultured Roseobacter sp. TaxID=114847 RepID=UPI00261497B4|nr:biliverdin-producing heme oxygenase [uncultured Roseobacter sp.]
MNAPPDNRLSLKAATSDAHASAEAVWFDAGAFSSPDRYRLWLGQMLAVHSDMGLRAAGTVMSGAYLAPEEARCAALARDLGTSPPPAPDQPASESWSWGVLYALNGSALGASVIHRTISRENSWPLEYLTVMRDFATTGGVKQFFDRLNAVDLSENEARRGADAVFARLGEYHAPTGSD